VVSRLLLVAGATALGLALQQVVAARLAAIQALSETDLLAARSELAQLLQIAAVALVTGIGGLGAAIVLSCRRAHAEGRFPPAGMRSFGRARVPVTGPRARTLATTGIVLGILLVVCAAAAGGLLWYMAGVLRMCRARVG
jgi:hypothetical protein